MPTNHTRMSLQTKLLISGGAIVLLIAAPILYLKLRAAGPPIEVGDGSITFQYPDGIDKKSNHQIEVSKVFSKVRTISISDYNSLPGAPHQDIDVDGREWVLTSNDTPQFMITLRSHAVDTGKGVGGTCASPAGWVGTGSSYTCVPTVGTKLTPATLTFTDGDLCPIPGSKSPSCPIDCSSKKCDVRFYYK